MATTPAPTLALFAGNTAGAGNLDSNGAAARFSAPAGIAADSDGNVYVVESYNNTIRKITPAGDVSTLAGTYGVQGIADGSGSAARFNFPLGIATDTVGNVYVADTFNNTIRKITPAGVVSTLAGIAGVAYSGDGIGTSATFNNPAAVATDNLGDVYVADSRNHTIRKITPSGLVSTLAGRASAQGSADGSGSAARFTYPMGIATDSTGNVYVADSGNNTIRMITPAGVVSTLAGTAGVQGSADGNRAAASFNAPRHIATDSLGNVYVADSGNNTIRMITPAGVVSTLAGTAGAQGSADGNGAAASFFNPYGTTTDRAGNVYVADYSNRTIRKITSAGVVSTFAGTAGVQGSADGTGGTASFSGPGHIATDSVGNVYVADSANDTIRKITPAGVVSTFAGAAGAQGSVDGTGAAARFKVPGGVATDNAGNVYVADSFNNTIRKITPAGVVSTLAGTAGVQGSGDGTGSAASFYWPNGIATDSAGNVYVAELANNTIRKITPAGVVSTLAGTAGAQGSVDGIGAAARFDHPSSVATDSAGNVYVSDSYNSTIRKITPAGVVSTLAGMAGVQDSVDGIGSTARLVYPQGMATDRAGNLYVADNTTIRKITPTGVVTTVVGVPRKSGFVPGALPGIIGAPHGVAIYGSTLYMTMNNGVASVTNFP
ncbi:MAG: hypothetical protein KGN37_08530 [Burkholderiales bacterium]|nr:hypothetical protein [Burkholderiales bacterium]